MDFNNNNIRGICRNTDAYNKEKFDDLAEDFKRLKIQHDEMKDKYDRIISILDAIQQILCIKK